VLSQTMKDSRGAWTTASLTDKSVNLERRGSADEVMKRVISEVDTFVGGAKQHDDMTTIVCALTPLTPVGYHRGQLPRGYHHHEDGDP
jgi:hypothetical protein